MFDAVVLAGTGKVDSLSAAEGVSNKAFINLGDQPVLGYVLQALNEAPSIGRVLVVGPAEPLTELKQDNNFFTLVEEQDSMLANMAAALEQVEQNRLALIVTADIPLINAAVVEQFLQDCAPHDHDLYYPVLTRETCLDKFPETERTYVRLLEGYLTGGNIGLINPRWLIANQSRLELFISYRKKPLKLLRILPLILIVKYLIKRLSVSDLERSLSRLMNLKARAVFTSNAEIGLDIDKQSDLALVRRLMQC